MAWVGQDAAPMLICSDGAVRYRPSCSMQSFDDRQRAFGVNPCQHQRERAVCRASQEICLSHRVPDEPCELSSPTRPSRRSPRAMPEWQQTPRVSGTPEFALHVSAGASTMKLNASSVRSPDAAS